MVQGKAPGGDRFIASIRRRGAGQMCHASGRAIDLSGIECIDSNGNPQKYWAIDSKRSQGKFAELYRCLTGYTQAGSTPTNGARAAASTGAVPKMRCLWHMCCVGGKCTATHSGGGDSTICHRNHLHCGFGCGGGGF